MTIADLLAKSAWLRDEAHKTVKQAERVQDAVFEILTARERVGMRMATALHLQAAIQVVRAYQHRRRLTVADTRHAVQEAALRIAEGTAGPETQELAAKLENVTGVGIGELGTIAEDWPEI